MAKQSREERIKANAQKELEALGVPPDMEAPEGSSSLSFNAEHDTLKAHNAELAAKLEECEAKYAGLQKSADVMSNTIADLQKQLAERDQQIAELSKAEEEAN